MTDDVEALARQIAQAFETGEGSAQENRAQDALAALLAEVDRLNREVTSLNAEAEFQQGQIRTHMAEVDRLRAREAALEEALRELTDDEMVMGCDSDGARCCNGCWASVGSPHTDACPVTQARALLPAE